MPKKKSTEGPFVTAALFCERVLQEGDGVISAIRIVDRTLVDSRGRDAPERLPPTPITSTLLICLKSGAARGRVDVTIKVEMPDGQASEVASIPAFFESEDRGVNLVIQPFFVAELEGLYWFDMWIGSRRITRVPYRVIYQRMKLQ